MNAALPIPGAADGWQSGIYEQEMTRRSVKLPGQVLVVLCHSNSLSLRVSGEACLCAALAGRQQHIPCTTLLLPDW